MPRIMISACKKYKPGLRIENQYIHHCLGQCRQSTPSRDDRKLYNPMMLQICTEILDNLDEYIHLLDDVNMSSLFFQMGLNDVSFGLRKFLDYI